MGPQNVIGRSRCAGSTAFVQHALDLIHRAFEPGLQRLRQGLEQRRDLLAGGAVEAGEDLTTQRGQRQVALARILGRSGAGQEALFLEAPQDAAQIAGVEGQILDQIGGRRSLAMRQLIENAGLGEAVGLSSSPSPSTPICGCRSG
jgi:hypothetical protein